MSDDTRLQFSEMFGDQPPTRLAPRLSTEDIAAAFATMPRLCKPDPISPADLAALPRLVKTPVRPSPEDLAAFERAPRLLKPRGLTAELEPTAYRRPY